MDGTEALARQYGLALDDVQAVEAELRHRGLHQVLSFSAWLHAELLKAASRKRAAAGARLLLQTVA